MRLLLACTRGLLHRTYMRHALALHAATREQAAAWGVPIKAARGWRLSELHRVVTEGPSRPPNRE